MGKVLSKLMSDDTAECIDIRNWIGMCVSNRPERSSAGSIAEGRLVAATIITPSVFFTPSKSSRARFTKCSRIIVALLSACRNSYEAASAFAIVAPVDLIDEDDAGTVGGRFLKVFDMRCRTSPR